MRILFSSNAAWASTGYGIQCKLFIPRLQKLLGHDLALFAWYGLEGAMLNWNGVPIYPRAYDVWGNDVVSAHAAHFRADLVISLIDAWVLNANVYGKMQHAKWAAWAPVDMEPIPQPVLEKMAQSFQPLVYARFAERLAHNVGLDVRYVPLGVDTSVFKPRSQPDAREALKWPTDRFIVGVVAANKGFPARKSWPQMLTAFAEFKRKHTDTWLYLHTTKGAHGEMQGVNLPELCAHLGLVEHVDVEFCDQYQSLLGFNDDYMVNVYNGMDVLLNPSMGEGFGVPIVEAQACGSPVITGDWTSMSELTFAGWAIPRAEADPTWTPLGSWQFTPRVGAIVDALEMAYQSRYAVMLDGAHDLGLAEVARQGALAYDADTVTRDYWKPVLSEIEARIVGEKTGLEVVPA